MKQRLLATIFTCGLLVWGGVAAFVELREEAGDGGASLWKIDYATDAGPLTDEDVLQFTDILSDPDEPRLNLFLDDGRLGVAKLCALDGTLCSTASEISDAVTGYVAGDGLSLAGNSFSVSVDDSTVVLSGGDLQIKDLGVAAGKLANDAVTTLKILDSNVTLNKLAGNSVNSSKIVNDTILFEDLTGGLVLTAGEDVGGDLGGGATNVIPTTDAVIGYVTATLIGSGDDLGNHTATQTLVLGGQSIDGASFDVDGGTGNTLIGGTLGAGAATLSSTLAVAGNVTVNTDKFTVDAATGNVVSEGTITSGIDGGADGALVLRAEEGVTDFTYTISPHALPTEDVTWTLPVDNGTVDFVLKTDGSGQLSWVAQSGADNLGTGVADVDLDMSTFDILGTTGDITYTNFTVAGATGNTAITGTLDVTGATGIDGNFDVGGADFTVDSATGNTAIAGTLGLTGAATLSSTLDVTGATGIDGNFDVGGADFTVDAATGNTAIAGILGVTGATTLSSTLDVTGAITGASIQLGGGGTIATSISNATDLGAGSASDSNLATQLAVKTYVDAQAGDDLGNHTATQDLNMDGNWIGGDDTGGEGIFVKTDGFVGVGTNDPSAELHVNGRVLASGTITSSDRRLKNTIEPLENSLEKIRQIDGYSYLWNDKVRGNGVQFGVIAQELEEIYPDVVDTLGDGYKAVNYQALIAPLIESVKELADRVEMLEAENQKLQKQLQQ